MKFTSQAAMNPPGQAGIELGIELCVLVFVQEGFCAMWGGCHIPSAAQNARRALILAGSEGLLALPAPALANASPAPAPRGCAAVQRLNSVEFLRPSGLGAERWIPLLCKLMNGPGMR